MNLTILLAIAWVFAATFVAFLPMRRQYLPGSILLAAAPVVIVLLCMQVHWAVGLGALFAFLSMFRNPLHYFWKKWRGLPVERPE